MKLILGSQSKGRAGVLKKAGYPFTVMHASIDEKLIRSDDYHELPILIARAKARALLPQITEPALLITADLVVLCNGELREKPESYDQAKTYLESYSHNVAKTVSAVVVTNIVTGIQQEGIDCTAVYFNEIPDLAIQQMLDQGAVMHTAGALIIEDPLVAPHVQKIEGDLDSVIGLPMKLLERLIKLQSSPHQQ